MNPGPVEEGGKAVNSIIDALKQQPAVLALTIANMALLIFIFYALHGSAQTRSVLVNQVLENSKAINQILQTRSVSCPQ
jgi:hypothetical protein